MTTDVPLRTALGITVGGSQCTCDPHARSVRRLAALGEDQTWGTFPADSGHPGTLQGIGPPVLDQHPLAHLLGCPKLLLQLEPASFLLGTCLGNQSLAHPVTSLLVEPQNPSSLRHT